MHGIWFWGAIQDNTYPSEAYVHEALDKCVAGKIYLLAYWTAKTLANGDLVVSSGGDWSRIPTLLASIRSHGNPDKYEAHAYVIDSVELDWDSQEAIDNIVTNIHKFKKWGWDGIQCDLEKYDSEKVAELMQVVNRWHNLFNSHVPRQRKRGVLQIGDGVPRRYNFTSWAVLVGGAWEREFLADVDFDFVVPMLYGTEDPYVEGTFKAILDDALDHAKSYVIAGLKATTTVGLKIIDQLGWIEDVLSTHPNADKFAGMMLFRYMGMLAQDWVDWNASSLVAKYADVGLPLPYSVSGRK